MALETLTLTSLTELEARVARGVERLDECRPGWYLEVDVSMIEIGCETHSITGQLFGPQLVDQFVGVGITPNPSNPQETIDEFIGMGFGVLCMDQVSVPDEMKALMRQVAVELAALGGLDASFVSEVPDTLPVPRNPDRMTQEAATVEFLWEREIGKRLS